MASIDVILTQQPVYVVESNVQPLVYEVELAPKTSIQDVEIIKPLLFSMAMIDDSIASPIKAFSGQHTTDLLDLKSPTSHNHDTTYEPKNANIQSHISNVTTNPHDVTAAQVGAYTTGQADTLLSGKSDTTHSHNLDDLLDVTITTPSSGQALKYVAGTGWVNGDVSATVALDDISDVTITTPILGQVVKYNGTTWVNDVDNSGITDHTALTNIGTNTHANIDTHIASTSNPHSVTAGQVGAQPVSNDLTSIDALVGTTGLLKKTATDTWTLDTTAYTTNLGTVTSVSGTAPVSVATGTTTPVISMAAATAIANGYMTSTYASKLDGIAAGAQVNVGTNITSTAGTTSGPVINSSTGTGVTLPSASGTESGIITTGTQTIAGVKTLTNANLVTPTIGAASGTSLTLTGGASASISVNGTNILNEIKMMQFALMGV